VIQTPEEVALVREKILDAAVGLIVEEGFNKLSMRKIALRLGVTASNLYYYFESKDEINVMVRVQGFCMLYDRLVAACARNHAPSDQLQAMIEDYVGFGIAYPDYYYVMYLLREPKYLNYVGTRFEAATCEGKLRAVSTHRITIDVYAIQ
jgi:AcrR family transcriptional regulator